MAIQFTEQVTLTSIECGECGITFAVPETWRQEKKKSGEGWFCPNGHARIYAESDIDRLRKQLDRERRTRQAWQSNAERYERQHDAAERSAAAYKGQTTKLKKRAAAGTCPCCKRTVSQLAEHMKTRHPEYVEEAKTTP